MDTTDHYRARHNRAECMTICDNTNTTVNVDLFAQYIFSHISRMALYDVSEKINQNSTKRTNSYLRENLVARKCSL